MIAIALRRQSSVSTTRSLTAEGQHALSSRYGYRAPSVELDANQYLFLLFRNVCGQWQIVWPLRRL